MISHDAICTDERGMLMRGEQRRAKISFTRINSAGALLAIRLLSNIFSQTVG